MLKRLKRQHWNSSWIMSIIICFLMFWELERMINFPGSEEIYFWLQVGELILLGTLLPRLQFRSHPWFIVLFCGLATIFITSAIRSTEILDRTKFALMRGVLIYILCPSIGVLLSGKDLKRFLAVFIACWILFYDVLSVIGLYCAENGIQIIDFSQQFEINVREDNLKLFAHPNITSANLMLCILMAVVGMVMSTHKVVKLFYGLSIGLYLVALSLAGGRASFVGTGVGLGIAVAAPLLKACSRKITKRIWQCCIIVMVVAITVVVTVIGLNAITDLYNEHQSQRISGWLRSTASAETLHVNEQEVSHIQKKDFLGKGLSGRERVYKAAYHLLRQQPSLLLTGTSIPLVMDMVNSIADYGLDHVHCMPLQILLETGITGFLLMLLFLVMLFIAIWRLYFDFRNAFWTRLIFLPSVGMLCVETIECITRLDKGTQAPIPLMLFAGITLALAFQNQGCFTKQNTQTRSEPIKSTSW